MKKAYTLVELLVTIAVLTAVAAFTIPTYQLILSQFQLTTSTNQVAEVLRLTEQKTVTEQKVYGATLTAGATTIPQFLYNTTTGTKTVQSTLSLPADIVISAVHLTGGASEVRFSASGAPNVSGDIVIRDVVRNRSRMIEIRPSGTILSNQGEY